MTAHDDRARDEQPAPPRFRVLAEWVHDDAQLAGGFAAHLMSARGAETASVEPLVEQPAPTARETAAEDKAVAIASEFRATALRIAPDVGVAYEEVSMRLLDEVLCDLLERGVIAAPTAREIPANEPTVDSGSTVPAGEPAAAQRLRLAAAERGPGDVGGGWIRVVLADDLRAVLAEYDERGRKLLVETAWRTSAERERDAARAEVERLREELGGVEGERDAADDSLAMLRTWLGVADEAGWMNVARARIGELEQLRIDRTAWEMRMDDLREEFRKIDEVRERDRQRLRHALAGLRGQEAAASFVAQTWRALDPDVKDATDPTLAEWLDALARAHEEKDGGQDR